MAGSPNPNKSSRSSTPSHESAKEKEEDDGQQQTCRIVAKLEPERVRWFYKKSESAKDKVWYPLNGKDSLALEAAYRRHQGILKRGETTPSADTSWANTAVALGGLYGMVYEATERTSQPKEPSEPKLAVIKPRRCRYRLKPLYWPGSYIQLARGTWFFTVSGENMQPLDGSSPELAEKVERQHMKMFCGQAMPDKPNQDALLITPVCQVKDTDEERKPGHGAEVRWFSVVDVFLYNHGHRSRWWRYLKGTKGTKLTRGYRTEARLDDGPSPATDIIFVIHGIGQKRAKNKIVKLVALLRESSEHLLKVHFHDAFHRPVFLPVDWRTELDFDEHIMANLTPDFLQQVRDFMNEAVMDLMYYASPVHGLKITRAVSSILNRMYSTFLTHDPGFVSRNGRVSVLAHSLGSVIMYDILTIPENNAGLMVGDDRVSVKHRPDAETTRLTFPVHHLFCIGSPLGIYLAARHMQGPRILHPPGVAPDFRLHNLYHQADVVAYRLEPLVSEAYASVRPLEIHRENDQNPEPYEKMPTLLLVREKRSGKSSSKSSKSPQSKEPPAKESKLDDTTSDASTTTSDSKSAKSPSKSDAKGKEKIVKIPPDQMLPYRIDYVLKSGRFVNLSKYWLAIGAHNSYWWNGDILMYTLSALYGLPKSSPNEKK